MTFIVHDILVRADGVVDACQAGTQVLVTGQQVRSGKSKSGSSLKKTNLKLKN